MMAQRKYLLLFFLAVPVLALGASAVWPGTGIGWIILLVGSVIALLIYLRTRGQGGSMTTTRATTDTSPNPAEELKDWQEAHKKERK
jgi:hypothetical protein